MSQPGARVLALILGLALSACSGSTAPAARNTGNADLLIEGTHFLSLYYSLLNSRDEKFLDLYDVSARLYERARIGATYKSTVRPDMVRLKAKLWLTESPDWISYSYVDPTFVRRDDHLEIVVNEVRGNRIHRIITFGVRLDHTGRFSIIHQDVLGV